MKKIYTEEQKAYQKIYQAEYRLKNKTKLDIYQAKWNEENKARKISANIEWLANRSDEKVAADKAKARITSANWYQENKEYSKQQMQEWNEANPSYYKEWVSQHNLGYWVVYVIRNFNGLKNDYAGQTQNIYFRMANHKSDGRLNTETHEILEKFDNMDEALGFELTLHLAGYHGKYTREH